jgi:hypothetical protein
MKTYLHTVHRASGSVRRLYVGDCVLDFTVGRPGSVSRRVARRIAARNRHAENCYQTRLARALAAGHSAFAAECIAAQ